MLKKQTLERGVAANAAIVSVARAGGGSVVGGVRKTGRRLAPNVRHPLRGSYRAAAVRLVNELLIPPVRPEKITPVLIAADPERVYPNQDGIEFAD